MNKIKIVLSAVLVAAAGSTFAADMTPTREQRMDQALQDYRSKGTTGTSSTTNSSMSGNAVRSDRPSMDKGFKDNMKAAGRNLKEGGREVGHDVAQGARKTGHAVHKGSDKVVGKAKSMTTDKPAP
jgi:hypothetical protein